MAEEKHLNNLYQDEERERERKQCEKLIIRKEGERKIPRMIRNE